VKVKHLKKGMTMRCFSVETNHQRLDGGAMFGHVPKTLWSQWVQCDEMNRVELACRCLVLQTDNTVLLYDTGPGNYMDPAIAERYGVEPAADKLTDALAAHDIPEDQVDYVVLSHLHFDHAGGLLPDWPGIRQSDWSLRFPNAIYVTSRQQFERATTPRRRDRASYIPELVAALHASNRVLLLESANACLPRLEDVLTFRLTYGHTPGLLHMIVSTTKTNLLCVSDIIPGTLWLNPAIAIGYDRYAEKAGEEKQMFIDDAVSEHWTLFYTHDPQVAGSRISHGAKGKYEASDPLQTIDLGHA